MTNILKDINDVHWWFNCFVTIMLIALGYIVTEYLIKPIGLSTKQRSKGDFLISKSDKVDYAADVLFIKENEREEMRMRFDLTYIQRGISVRLMMLIVIIPAIGRTLSSKCGR